MIYLLFPIWILNPFLSYTQVNTLKKLFQTKNKGNVEIDFMSRKNWKYIWYGGSLYNKCFGMFRKVYEQSLKYWKCTIYLKRRKMISKFPFFIY